MEDNIKILQDQIKYYDNMSRINKTAPRLRTEIECYNEFGEKLFTNHNELVLSGGLFLLQKLANAAAPINIQTMNTDLNILPKETNPGYTGLRREDCLFGFAVGVSGCTDVFDTVKPVEFKNRKVNGLIPIRRVYKSDGLTSQEKSMYSLQKTAVSGGIQFLDYYAKKFESQPVIKCVFDEPGNPAVPANVDQLATNSTINCYLEIVLKIGENDLRDYFETDGGGLRKARVNSLALLTGYPDATKEMKGVRLFSLLDFNNEPFDNESKELTYIYKIFI